MSGKEGILSTETLEGFYFETDTGSDEFALTA